MEFHYEAKYEEVKTVLTGKPTKIEEIEMTGASKSKYKFGIYPLAEKFLNIGAVYIFYGEIKIGVGTAFSPPIYIGETGDLKNRFGNDYKDHHKWECIKSSGAKFVGIHYDSNNNSREAIEQDLLDAHSTPCND